MATEFVNIINIGEKEKMPGELPGLRTQQYSVFMVSVSVSVSKNIIFKITGLFV